MMRRKGPPCRANRRASATFYFRELTTLSVLGLAWSLVGCSSSAGGPEYYEIGLFATDGQGMETDQACTPVPVMPGASVGRDVSLFGAFGAHVGASRDLVTVRFVGVTDPQAVDQDVTRQALGGGYANSFDVQATSGEHFTVALISPCKVEN